MPTAVKKARNKLAFEFHDGTNIRRMDGITLSLRLTSKLDMSLTDALSAMEAKTMPEPKKDETKEQKQERQAANLMILRNAAESALRVVEVAREVFEIQPYAFDETTDTETGLTASDVLEVFYSFLDWQQVEKKNTDTRQSLPASTAPKYSPGRKRNN